MHTNKKCETRTKGSSQKVRRTQILLKADADGPGWTDERIAEAFNCRVQTVENTRKRLVTESFQDALNGKKRETPPTPPLLDGKGEAKLIAMRLGKPPVGYGRWTLQLLADELIRLEVVDSISHETVRKTLKKNGGQLANSWVRQKVPDLGSGSANGAQKNSDTRKKNGIDSVFVHSHFLRGRWSPSPADEADSKLHPATTNKSVRMSPVGSHELAGRAPFLTQLIRFVQNGPLPTAALAAVRTVVECGHRGDYNVTPDGASSRVSHRRIPRSARRGQLSMRLCHVGLKMCTDRP